MTYDGVVSITNTGTTSGSTHVMVDGVKMDGGKIITNADTATGDPAAVGYTAAGGLILTGQGTTSDVTIRNDAGSSVATIPTGTTTWKLDGDLVGNVMTYDGVVSITNTGTTSGSTHVMVDGVKMDGGKIITNADTATG